MSLAAPLHTPYIPWRNGRQSGTRECATLPQSTLPWRSPTQVLSVEANKPRIRPPAKVRRPHTQCAPQGAGARQELATHSVHAGQVCMYVCMYVCNHICIRRVLLLSSGCPSWYEEGKVKNQTLTKPMPRTQRNPSILSERIKLGKSYDVWLANQAPEMKHRLKRYL